VYVRGLHAGVRYVDWVLHYVPSDVKPVPTPSAFQPSVPTALIGSPHHVKEYLQYTLQGKVAKVIHASQSQQDGAEWNRFLSAVQRGIPSVASFRGEKFGKSHDFALSDDQEHDCCSACNGNPAVGEEGNDDSDSAY
jgi:hypothetical protein